MKNETDAGRVIVAYDVPSEEALQALAGKLQGTGTRAKVGMELFTALGPVVFRSFSPGEVFLDLKYHDIPNTVAGATRAASRHGAWMINVHCDGGREMMEAAAKAAKNAEQGLGYRPLVIGVTVLTSMSMKSLGELQISPSMTMPEIVARRAKLAQDCGLDGVVCSPLEVREVRNRVTDDFIIVTPGIRNADSPPDDQQRTATVMQAVSAGSDYVVIGRPITASEDPAASALKFIQEVRVARASIGKEVEAK